MVAVWFLTDPPTPGKRGMSVYMSANNEYPREDFNESVRRLQEAMAKMVTGGHGDEPQEQQ